jgi:membrane protein
VARNRHQQDRQIDLRDDRTRRGEGDRGRTADRPREIPKPGWKDIAVRVKDEIRNDRVSLTSAGVAFYAMLALFPALTALVSLYGLVADPEQVQEQVDALTQFVPAGAGDIITNQAQAIAETGQGALTAGFVVSLVALLWTASSGMHGLVQALTLAYNEDESRGFVKRRAISLGLTLVGFVFFALAVAVVVAVPIVLGVVGLGAVGEWLVRILRWPLMGALLVLVLGMIYRYAPDRRTARKQWVTPGAVLATVLWVVASIGFSIYVANFGNYQETYGALGAVIVLLLWLFLSAFVVVVGAEVNAEMEHQTLRDSTEGGRQPMGRRGAQVADHVGKPAT